MRGKRKILDLVRKKTIAPRKRTDLARRAAPAALVVLGQVIAARAWPHEKDCVATTLTFRVPTNLFWPATSLQVACLRKSYWTLGPATNAEKGAPEMTLMAQQPQLGSKQSSLGKEAVPRPSPEAAMKAMDE